MTIPSEITTILRRLETAGNRISTAFTGRDAVVRLLTLSAMCHEHVLLIGPAGTAKTEIVMRFAELIEASSFHYLLTRYTEPSELFGPVDMEQFQRGVYRVRTERMLPKAQIAFLDEIFHAGSPVLNALLTLLAEREFLNGADVEPCPLITLIGATNHFTDDPWLHAFSDRFALRAVVEATADEQLGDLLVTGWELETQRVATTSQRLAGQKPTRDLPALNAGQLAELHKYLTKIDVTKVRPVYLDVIRQLRAEGVDLSDRRVVRSQKLVAGAALLRGSQIAEPCDLWPLLHSWSRPEQEVPIKQVLQPLLGTAGDVRAATRDREDIRLQLESLEHQLPQQVTQPAIAAFLRVLNDVRRELLRDHPQDGELRTLTDKLIQGGLTKLESAP